MNKPLKIRRWGEEMKKLFTIDDFMIAFVSAVGYGLGTEIPHLLGAPAWLGYVVSMGVGMLLEGIVSKIVFSKAVQKKTTNKICVFAGFLLIFALGQAFLSKWSNVSLLNYVKEQQASAIVMPLLGFGVSMLMRFFQTRKIRKLYGDGSKGFVYDLKQEDIDVVNRQNKPITGEYDSACAVKTRTGIYVGTKGKEITWFSGIPYAKPPVGERRWKAPEPLDDTDAVFEAKYPGASAVQVEFEGSILRHHRQSEDCLTLNICSGSKEESEKKTRKKKPVMVFFHHGDFSYGGSADPLIYGDSFAKANPDIVIVSFNYRLGIFGFIDFAEIPGGEAYPDAANLGLLDQIAALKWVRENIAAFGGDPDKITVMGFESGATSICLLAACEEAKGLFRRAFVFSGSPAGAYDTPDGARALAKKLLELTGTSTMEELCALPTERLKAAGQKLWLNMAAPTCGGGLIPADVYAAYRSGAASGVEFIIGIPSNERSVYKSVIGGENYESFVNGGVDGILGVLDDAGAEAVSAYIRQRPADMSELDAKARIIEQWTALCTYRSAAELSAGGGKVYLMYWNAKPLIENLGSGTVDVASALFGNSEAAQMYGNVMDKDLSEVLQSLMAKFIRGEALRLYNNEIKGIDALDWKKYPKALILSNDKILCEPIEGKLTEIKGLTDSIAQ